MAIKSANRQALYNAGYGKMTLDQEHKGKAYVKPQFAILQINITAGAVARNVAQIKRAVSGAMLAAGTKDLICIAPELAVSGFPLIDLPDQKGFLETCSEAIIGLAKELKDGPTLVLGAPERRNGVNVSTLFVLSKGSITSLGSRPLEFAEAYGLKHRAPLPCDAIYKTFDFLGHRFAVRPGFATGGSLPPCDIVLSLDCEAFEPSLFAERELVCMAYASMVEKPIIYVNAVGGNGSIVCYGGSTVCDASGKILLSTPCWRQEILIDNIDLLISNESSSRKDDQFSKNDLAKENLDPYDAVGNAILLGIRDFVRKSGFSKVCLGLSGGRDSSLVAALACDALGKENVIPIMLPSPYTSEESIEDAKTLAENLGIELKTLQIKPMMDAFDSSFSIAFGARLVGLSAENIQARIRATALMAVSNQCGALLLSTSNKSESAVGYGTIYGDMAGAFMPIVDVYKTDVYKLADWINRIHGREIIPENVFKKEPTAELRYDQKDQDSLPPYNILDTILRGIFEGHDLLENATSAVADQQIVAKVAELVRKSEFKRAQSPLGLYVSSCPLALCRRSIPSSRVK